MEYISLLRNKSIVSFELALFAERLDGEPLLFRFVGGKSWMPILLTRV
jgi:hypothetical protein